MTQVLIMSVCGSTGGNWPGTFVLWLVDHVTFKHCDSTGLPCDAKDAETVSVSAFCDDCFLVVCV